MFTYTPTVFLEMGGRPDQIELVNLIRRDESGRQQSDADDDAELELALNRYF
jgi:hypothetical protein